jgi:hypothetical protein
MSAPRKLRLVWRPGEGGEALDVISSSSGASEGYAPNMKGPLTSFMSHGHRDGELGDAWKQYESPSEGNEKRTIPGV